MNTAANQLSGYGYDANGNQISSGYTYDPENRIEFADNGSVQDFYDGQNSASGRRPALEPAHQAIGL